MCCYGVIVVDSSAVTCYGVIVVDSSAVTCYGVIVVDSSTVTERFLLEGKCDECTKTSVVLADCLVLVLKSTDTLCEVCVSCWY